MTFNNITLNTHKCTEEELGLSDDKAKNDKEKKFYPVAKESQFDAKRLVGSWNCIDEEQDQEIELFGNYHTGTAQTIRIHLELCNVIGSDATEDCEKVEIDDLTDKYIVVLMNERNFDKDAPSERRLIDQSRVTWIPVTDRKIE